jgi:hypothetical protein
MPLQLNKADAAKVRHIWMPLGDLDLAVSGADVRLGDEVFEPDPTLAYFTFECAFSYPVVTAYNMALHPQVIGNSFDSFRRQMVNIGHLVKSYNKDTIARDRIIGHICAVDFPKPPITASGTYSLPKPGTPAPRVRGVGAMFKVAEGVDRIIGTEQTSRRKWTVSMEVKYVFDQGGFLITTDDVKAVPGAITTPELAAHGVVYCAYTTASKELRSCLDAKKQLVKPFNGMPCVYLHGGLNGYVHFAGLGIVTTGAEPPARIGQMVAGKVENTKPAARFVRLSAALKDLSNTLKNNS